MYKILLSLFLITPILANDSNHVDITTSSIRNLQVQLGEEFTITAFPWPSGDLPTIWHLISYSPFELTYEDDGCIKYLPGHNTQIWTFKATELGNYTIMFATSDHHHLREKISVEVYKNDNDGK